MNKKLYLILSFLLIILYFSTKDNSNYKGFNFNFKYQYIEREIITEKIKNYSDWQLWDNHPYFINGLIRKIKPKKCLEIGIASGGSSILILNAIKDMKGSFLISLDLNSQLYINKNKKTGYAVKQFFPELTNKWKLFTGAQPHKFLENLNMKFDFLLLDTAHLMPGEAINFIEVLPFLEENAIIVLHDITYHLLSEEIYGLKTKKSYFSNIYLMTSLYGEKIILENKTKVLENIGAIKLYPNQKKFYLNYFLLLLSPWEYIPEEKHINELKLFIKKYYKKELYINIFNKAVEENKNMIEIRK